MMITAALPAPVVRAARVLGLTFVLVLAAGGTRAVVPGELEGVRFAQRIELSEGALELRGVGLLRYRMLFKAYVAALYGDPRHPPGAWQDDVPKRLEIEYFWSIRGPDFGPAAERILERSLPADALARIRPQLERLHAHYEDVAPGDRYALTYLPGRGTELAKNGEPKVLVPGAEFAAAYFGIWLGAKPIDAELRDRLLGTR